MKATTLLTATACTTVLGLALPLPALAAPHDGEHDHGKGGSHRGSSGQDPAGNNGTIKIGTSPAGTGRGNVPHPGCAFTLRFFGFDAGQNADITFRGQAPTRTGTLLHQAGVAVSDDAAGGGQDADAVLTYTAAQLGLTGTPQARQGWHVKVDVDLAGAPGGAKHKVLWLRCAQPASAPTAGSGSSTSTGTTSTTATSSTSTSTSSTSTTALTGSGGGSALTLARRTTDADRTAVPRSGSSLATGGGGAGRAGSAGASSLPFTGDETALLAATGLGLVGAGTAAVVLGRRRRIA